MVFLTTHHHPQLLTQFHIPLHARRSSHHRGDAIVILHCDLILTKSSFLQSLQIELTSLTLPPLPNHPMSLIVKDLSSDLTDYPLAEATMVDSHWMQASTRPRAVFMNVFAYSELRSFIREETEGHGLLDAAWAWSFQCDLNFNLRTREVI